MNNKYDSEVYPIPELPQIPQRTFRITDYGAEAEGLLCTSAIQDTLDACAGCGRRNGDHPAWNLAYRAADAAQPDQSVCRAGALVCFEPDYSRYPLLFSHYEGTAGWRCQAPLDGEDLSDVAITGEGIFDGSGEAWRPVKRFKRTELEWNSLLASRGPWMNRVRSGGLPRKRLREKLMF